MANPYMIDWAITNRCNLNCVHCRGMAQEELKDETILKLSREIVLLNPRWVIIEGGEPLLSKKLFESLKIIEKHNIRIYLISNGMLIDEDIVIRLRDLNVNLMISIDGADKESYEKTRAGASFKKLNQSVALANKHNILSDCPITIGKYNYEQTGKLLRLAEKIGYKKVTFLGLKPCKNYGKYGLNRNEYEKFLSSVIRYQRDYKIDISVDEPFWQPFLKERKINWSTRSENGINVREKPLDKIWDEIERSQLIKKIKNPRTRVGYPLMLPIPTRYTEVFWDIGIPKDFLWVPIN